MQSASTQQHQLNPPPAEADEPVRDGVVRPRKLKMEEVEPRITPGNGWSV
jgi:hypothetical protein